MRLTIQNRASGYWWGGLQFIDDHLDTIGARLFLNLIPLVSGLYSILEDVIILVHSSCSIHEC